MDLTSAELAPIRDRYAEGQYLQALAAASRFGPLRTWEGAAGRLLAGRLAMQLGAPRLGRRLHAVAFREYPANLEAVYYHARYRMDRFGPLNCHRFMRQHTDWSDASPELRADWLAFSAFIAARLRDFDRAERLLQQADGLAPQRAWIAVERASVLELQDRHEPALEMARKALDLQPLFRPAVQAVGHILHKLGRDEEAIAFLQNACSTLESSLVCAQLIAHLLDLERAADVLPLLDRYESLIPLCEKEVRQWTHARRADAYYRLERFEEAEQHARQVEEEFYTAFADRLRTRPAGTGMRLNVDSSGTSPASIDVLLSRYWDTTYPAPDAEFPGPTDGLPDADERKRAETAGFFAVEFDLTADGAESLIAAGIPFGVSLVEVGVSQTRLCVGCDPVRGSIWLYDGQEWRPAEAPLATLLERYRSTGPRAMAVIPHAKQAQLQAVLNAPGASFPNRKAYDALYAVQSALLAGNRTAASEAMARMSSLHPGHRLTKLGAVALARADQHPPRLLEALDALRSEFPDDATLILARAGTLRELGRTEERLALLKEYGSPRDADPLLMQSLAQMLLSDPQAQGITDRLLLRSIRLRPTAAAGYYLLASQWWERQRFRDAADLYRLATCLDDREEQFSESYFRVARVLNQAPDAVRLFQARMNRDAVPYVPAAKALFTALLDRDETDQAFGMLAGVIERAEGTIRGELLIFRAEHHAAHDQMAEAEQDLQAAKPLLSAALWHRAAAKIARLRPDFTTARSHIEAVLAVEPDWTEGHRVMAGLLAETAGKSAARDYLAVACQKQPHFYPLLRLRAEYLSGEPDDSGIDAVQRLIDECPNDAWALRQLALLYADRNRPFDAQTMIDRAGQVEPDHPSRFAVAAHLARRAERIDDALRLLREAVHANPDFEPVISELVNLSRGRKEKGQSLKYIAEQLRKRPHTGDGMVAYRDAYMNLADEPEDHEKLLERLQRFLDVRPDLWQSWSLVTQQYGIMHRLDEAYSLAKETAERFPLAAKVWLDLAEVARVKDLDEERIDALRHAVRAAPGWTPAARELTMALSDAGEEAEAIAVMERAVRRNPLDPLARGFLAEKLWDAGQSERALDQAILAVRHEPGYEWAWGAIADWSDRLDRPTVAIDLARELSRERSGDPRVWLKLARFLDDPEQAEESLQALDKAIALDTTNVDAHDLRAEKLAEVGRFEEALAASRPIGLTEDWPITLQGRAAWIEAKRGNYAAAIPPMQKLVSVNPDYVWGWHQLAEWYNETGRNENFLEAAGELVRLRPDHPMPLSLRGEAKIKAGDRSGGKEDLREALRVNPRFVPAAALLFDATLADGEMRDARAALAVLQEHLAAPEVAVKQIMYAVKARDKDAAVKAFMEVCQHDGETAASLFHVALMELRSAGWEEAAATALKSAVDAGPPFNPWSTLFWLDTEAGEATPPDDQISLLDRTLSSYPQFFPAHDRKATLLARWGRYDEAKAACRPATFGDKIPVPLRGRSAWVDAERGHRREAIRQMTAVLRDDPNYPWGWRMLAGWHEEIGETAEALRAAEQLVRLAPDDPNALIHRGTARRAVGDTGGAREDFRRAFDLDPESVEAGYHLIGEQLSGGDADAAAETLSRLQEFADGPLIRLRSVKVAAARPDLTGMRRDLRKLAEDEATPKELLRDAARTADEAGWANEVTDEFAEASRQENANPAVLSLWVERRAHAGAFDEIAGRITAIGDRTASREAILTYAAALTDAGRPDAAAGVIQQHSRSLNTSQVTWARAGMILSSGKLHSLAIGWLSDWRERSDLKAWMLVPLADSLRALDRDAEALDVLRAATAFESPGEEQPSIHCWLALDDAIRGRIVEAQTWLSPVDPLGLPDDIKLIWHLAHSLVSVATSGEKASAIADAKLDWHAALDACPPGTRPTGFARWYLRAVSALASYGGLGVKFWALGQRLRIRS